MMVNGFFLSPVGGGWNMNFIDPSIGNVVIPTAELIFVRGVGIPPTR